MSRFARHRRVFYWEEPIHDSHAPALTTNICPHTSVSVVTPHLPPCSDRDRSQMLEALLSEFARINGIENSIAWFYTPMALEFFPATLSPSAVIYDCMDELSMFRGAPRQMCLLENRLFTLADLVFTGGVSLFEAKRSLHKHVHAFASGVDMDHFVQARNFKKDFAEHQNIPAPRLGYAGVIDERMDLELIEEVARRRPDWQIMMLGPTAKIDPQALPNLSNIHWLGMKDYGDLPKYFAGWDVGIMPFAMNDSTRFISPTKTPEYLSSGLPVVSTPIRDVVRPYGDLGLARIAQAPEEFVDACEQAMTIDMSLKMARLERADEFLGTLSLDDSGLW